MTETIVYQTDTSDMRIPHGLFRSVFDTADSVIEGVRTDDAPHVAAVDSYFDNVLRFLDAHHGGEDAIVWPVLSQRCSTAAELLARMEGEHETIHQLRGRAGEALAAWTATPSASTARSLSTSLSDLRAAVETHFREEEAEILPLASRYMSAEEWGGLPGHAMQHFSGDKIWLILGLIFEQMSEEELAMTFTLLPPPVVDMWKSSGKAAFDEFIGRVRGTS